MSKALFRLVESFGRMGTYEALFVDELEMYEKYKDKKVYLGEALGKHSEIDVELSNLEIVSQDQEFINKIEKVVGFTLAGENLLELAEEQQEDE